MFTTIVIVVVLLAAVLGYAATRPDSFRVERAACIKAPPEKIFPLINDYRSWGAWSPYEKKDPAMRRTYSGAPIGRGAVYEWEGNNNIGKGRMEITESSVPSRVAIDMHFMKPFKARNVAEFTLQPNGEGTKVPWAMHGPATFVSKLMGLVVSMDKMIGKDFEAGLDNLKGIAET